MTDSQNTGALLPAPLQALLDLFAAEFAEVHFADIDASTLARLTREVQTANESMLAAQAVLDNARTALQEKRDTLMQNAHRALAYARVYAENDDALKSRVDAITLPSAKRAAPRETNAERVAVKRPRKSKVEASELLLGTDAAAE